MRPAGGREGYKVGQSRPARFPAFAATATPSPPPISADDDDDGGDGG